MAQQNSKPASPAAPSQDSYSHDEQGAEDLAEGRYQAEGYGSDPYGEGASGEQRGRAVRSRFNIDQVADQWIDGLIPEEIEWRRLVIKYPRISIGLAFVAGYLIGRTQGKALVAAAGAVAIEEISRVVEDSVGDIFG
jgi:hypothetical protein